MGYLKPSSWHGWPALILIAVLFAVAVLANGAHKSIKMAAYVGIAIVAVVATYNTFVKSK